MKNLSKALIFAISTVVFRGLTYGQALPIAHTLFTTNADPVKSLDGTGTQVGNGYSASASGQGVAIGASASAQTNAVAVGNGAIAWNGGVAIGRLAFIPQNIGPNNDVMIGNGSALFAFNTNTVNIGGSVFLDSTYENTYGWLGIPYLKWNPNNSITFNGNGGGLTNLNFTGNGSNLNLSTVGVSAAGAAINWPNSTIFGGAQTILKLQQVNTIFLIPDSKSVTLLHSNISGDRQGWLSYGGLTNNSTTSSVTNQPDGSIWFTQGGYPTNNLSWGIAITNLFAGLGYSVGLDTACAVPGGLFGYIYGGYGSSNNTYVPAGYGGNYSAVAGTYTNTINQGQDITWWPLSANDTSITIGGSTYTTNVGKNVTIQVAGTFGSPATFILAGTPGASITMKITQHYYPGQNTPNYWPPYTGTGFGGPLSTPPLNWITVSNSVAATGKQGLVFIMGPDNDFNGPVGDYGSIPSATNQVRWAVTNVIQACLAIRAAGHLVALGTSPLNYNEAQSPGVLFSNILDYNRQITAAGKNAGVCDVFIDWASTNSAYTNIAGYFIDGTHWSTNTARQVGTNGFFAIGGSLVPKVPSSTANLLNTNGNNGSPVPANIVLIGTNAAFPNGFAASEIATVVGPNNTVNFQASGVVLIGDGNTVGVSSVVAIGHANTCNSQNGGSVGTSVNVTGNGSFAFGNSITIPTAATESVAIGHAANVSGANSINIGGGNTVSGTNSVQLGYATTSQVNSNEMRWNDGKVWSIDGNQKVEKFAGYVQATNGYASFQSNLLAPSSITFPATTVNWTNSTGRNIFVFIDNTAVTGTSVAINGTTVFSGLSLDLMLPLQPGEYFSETYTVGTPAAKIKPQ